MNIVPLGNRVLVRRLAAGEVKYGSIIIPETAREKPTQGVVVALGDKVEAPVYIGDIVLLGKYAGSEIKIDGEDYLVIRDVDIMGKILEDNRETVVGEA